MTHPDHHVAATIIDEATATPAISPRGTGLDTGLGVDAGGLAFDVDPRDYVWFSLAEADEPQ